MAAEAPWWTRRSRIAIVFVAASVGGYVLGVAGPLLSDQKLGEEQRKLQAKLSKDQQDLQRKLADVTTRLENQSRKVDVSRLLFEHYFGKPPTEQRAVITYLTYQFPGDMTRKSVQAILLDTAKEKAVIRREVTKSVASIGNVTLSKRDRAVEAERDGLQAVIDGDLAKASKSFASAYAVFPTYHNVDEISHKVLAPTVSSWRSGAPELRRQLVRRAAGTIVGQYSWGIPDDLKPQLEKVARS